MKKTKLYKLSLFLLGLMFLVNFSFCLMPLIVSAQILNQPKEIVLEISQKDNKFNQEENCEDVDHNYKTNQTEPQETKAEQNNNVPNKNTAPLCCLDHEKITKIDAVQKSEISNLDFYAIPNESLLDQETLIQNSSYNSQSLDLPPPKADILSSVFKKE